MRVPIISSSAKRIAVILGLLLAGSALFLEAEKKSPFTPHEKAYYLEPHVVAYVQPGFTITIVSAQIASDGTISVDYKLADPNGAPLDRSGIVTPGPISVSFLAAYIPKGQAQYTSYIVKTATAASGGATATQAGSDSGGTTQTVAVGEYTYTYATKAPAGFDPGATHRIGMYGSRDLTQWDLGTNYADAVYDFVPAGGTPTPRDVVRTADCNGCHGLPNGLTSATGSAGLAAHGGTRRNVAVCIICHQPQTSDPDTGNTVDMKVMIHKIHMGSSLPSVQSGKPYQIVGKSSASDFSTVIYPADVRNCQTCHNPQNGAAQTNVWLTAPTRTACGSCHDDVNFATGQNHAGGPQISDNQCGMCHIPKGELEFDASIIGAHTIPSQSTTIPGLNFSLVKVENGGAGQKPTVTFTAKDNSGNGIPITNFTASGGALSLTMAGPTADYGYTSFGSDVTTPGYVTESIAKVASCSKDGTCTYTFTHAVPSNASGTYAIGIEGRLPITLLPGTTQQMNVNYGGQNQVIYFSVDGSPVTPRRTVVALSNCNNCHASLSVHGSLRNNTEYCVLCHNPSNTDAAVRSSASDAAEKTEPPQAINFALLAHKVHTGLNLKAVYNTNYIVIGFGGSINDFGAAFASVPAAIPNTGVRFPAMTPKGGTQDTTDCYLCHTNGSEAVFPIGLNAVTDPQGRLNPAPATTSACTACHLNQSALAHASANTDPKFGESCDICHSAGAAFDVTQVHAGQ